MRSANWRQSLDLVKCRKSRQFSQLSSQNSIGSRIVYTARQEVDNCRVRSDREYTKISYFSPKYRMRSQTKRNNTNIKFSEANDRIFASNFLIINIPYIIAKWKTIFLNFRSRGILMQSRCRCNHRERNSIQESHTRYINCNLEFRKRVAVNVQSALRKSSMEHVIFEKSRALQSSAQLDLPQKLLVDRCGRSQQRRFRSVACTALLHVCYTWNMQPSRIIWELEILPLHLLYRYRNRGEIFLICRGEII